MRRSIFLGLAVFVTLLILPAVQTPNISTTLSTAPNHNLFDLAETGLYSGTGSPLNVTLNGQFANGSTYIASGQTYSEDITIGSSFTVNNATTVTWTTYVSVSPPAEIVDINFSVDYFLSEWLPVSVSNPLGVAKSNPSDWTNFGGVIIVKSSAVDTFGLWKLTFTSSNQIFNLELGDSLGSLSSTDVFDIPDSMLFQGLTTSMNGGTSQLILTDPSGSIWYTASNTTSSPSSHLLPAFKYRKNITIDNGQVFADLTNYPVLVDIIDADLRYDVKSDASDLVFVQDGVILDHDIELFAYNGMTAHLISWVKANLSNTVDTVISMYYGSDLLGPYENPQAVWTNNYAAVWHLDEVVTNEQTSGTHLDATGNGYYGNQDGNDEILAKFGFGQSFDGANDMVSISSNRDLTPPADVTISGWFKLDNAFDSTSNTLLVMEKYLNGNYNMHIALAGADYVSGTVGGGSARGMLVLKVESLASGGGYSYVWTSTTSWSAGAWYSFTCTMDANNPTNNQIYINGVNDVGGNGGAPSLADLNYVAEWGIGGGAADGQIPGNLGFFDGDIDEVRVSTGIRTSNWILTEYYNLASPNTFYSVGSELNRDTYEPIFSKSLDASAPAGLWTASLHYNDSGSSVGYRTGLYERQFIVRHATDLTLDSPGDATGDGLSARVVGDLLYVAVNMTDTVDSVRVEGATISMNWTVSGSSTTRYFEDSGNGHYTLALNTSDLSSETRWRIDIQASHPYYESSSTFFDLDLYHPTELTYTSVSTTPIGNDFTATLIYRDTYTGSPISGADVIFANGTSVSVVAEGNGWYNISIPTTYLSKGNHWYIFNATKPGALYNMASVNVTFTLRAHYTAVSVSGDFLVPIGDDTPLTVVLIDLDTGLPADASNVFSITFDSIQGTQIENSPSGYSLTLDTSAWPISTTAVTVSVVMANSNFIAPVDYNFNIQIRAHYTSASVVGILTQPYGNDTLVTVVVTDLDTGLLVSVENVTGFSFTSSYGTQPDGASDFNVLLNTNTWAVGTTSVTLTITVNSTFYQAPLPHGFVVTIRSMTTLLYHAPSDLIFPNGDDFKIVLQYNVSEQGQYYGDYIDGFAGDITIQGYPIENVTIVGWNNGRYNVTIDSFHFPEGKYTITIEITPSSSLYAPTFLVVTFDYRPARSDLTSNLYTVSTPSGTNVTITLHYQDLDRSVGITTATISPTPIDQWIDYSHISDGDYIVEIGVVDFTIGIHQIDLTADADGYDARTVTIAIIVTRIHTDLEPELISVDIPVGNTILFEIEFNDLDNGIPIIGAVTNTNWTTPAPFNLPVQITWISPYYLVNITTSDSDPLGTYLIWFNFTKGAEYQPGYCEVEVTIRTHITIFSSQSAPAPTPYNGIVNISVRYYDFDNKVGITDDSNIQQYIWNTTHWVPSTLINNNNGYYTIQIDASQFPQGLQSFTVYFNWTGPVQKFENRQLQTSVNIIGVDSKLTLMISSEPTPFGEMMNYTFFYSDLSNIGIDNVTAGGGGNVYITVTFQGEVVDMSEVDILEVLGQPGNYSIGFNSSLFGRVGLIYMNVSINWKEGVAPFYTDRSDIISVRVLARDTLVSIEPVTPTAYGENATLLFYFEDVTGGTSTPISDSSSLSITTSLSETPQIIFSTIDRSFTISFNTAQFGAPLGAKSFTLDIVWIGEPFYKNRTGRVILFTITARLTSVEYLSPDPTQYNDTVEFTVAWSDVTTLPALGIYLDTTIELFNGSTPMIGFYDVVNEMDGNYTVTLDTRFYSQPGIYDLTIKFSNGSFFILNRSVTRSFNVRYRVTLLSAIPIEITPFNSTLEFTLNFRDLFSLTTIGNVSGDVEFSITGATWSPAPYLYTINWRGDPFNDYVFDFETYNQPFSVGVVYGFTLRMVYTDQSPFYDSDAVFVEFEFRTRASSLDLIEPPESTRYLDYANVTILFRDTDSGTGITIDTSDITIPAISDYIVYDLGFGYYMVSINTTELGGLGQHSALIQADWTLGSPYHDDASRQVSIITTSRDTNVEVVEPPSLTKYLNNVTFIFTYTDLGSGEYITAITTSNIEVWGDGSLLGGSAFTLIPLTGGRYSLSINSTELSPSLVSGYNLTISVDWNEAVAPYYTDDSTIIRITTTYRSMAYSIELIESGALGENLTFVFKLQDADTGASISGALIGFDAQSVGLAENSDFWITEGSGADLGRYTINVSSLSLTNPGDYLFDLNIRWNPSLQPFYGNLSRVVLTGTIREILTYLTTSIDTIIIPWKESRSFSVTYWSYLYGNETSGATVVWVVPGFASGNLTDPLSTGIYSTSIDASFGDSGTYLIRIEARRDRYQVAIAFITLIIQPIASDIELVDPPDVLVTISRGAGLNISIDLIDLDNAIPILDEYVTNVRVTFVGFDGDDIYYMFYTGIPGRYNVTIPSGSSTVQNPDTYDVRILATFTNYNPATSLLKVLIEETRTRLSFIGDTSQDVSAVYSEFVNFTVLLTAPDISENITEAWVYWYLSETGDSGNFTHIGNGTYSVLFNTTRIGTGIWSISIRANPDDDVYGNSATSLTLTVKRILTTVRRPSGQEKFWGWKGYFNFTYWDIPFNRGVNESNTLVTITITNLPATEALDLGSGTYLVYVDTTLLRPGRYSIEIKFEKENFQDGSALIDLIIQETPTDLNVSTTYVGDPLNLEVPIGDSAEILFFYNDIDDSDGFIGGISDAQTNSTYIFGSYLGITYITLVDVGDGYYRFVFNTLDAWLFNSTGGVPQNDATFTLDVSIKLENRSLSHIRFDLQIVKIPTTVDIVDSYAILEYGQDGYIILQLTDSWPTHNGNGVTGANFTVTSSNNEYVAIKEIEELSIPGRYRVTFTAQAPLLEIFKRQQTSSLTLILSIENYYIDPIPSVQVFANPTQIDVMISTYVPIAFPVLLILIVVVGLWTRVYSIPKRLRQINGQIKTMRKGKVPAPISEAKTRQQLVADLFNDTMASLEITRKPDQLPGESILVEVPEIGELLIQLSILTNLSQEELDEFKADISKMKISEQAAFVKEVIQQEAIRAARREGKGLDTILKEVEEQAQGRLRTIEEGEEFVIDEPSEPGVFDADETPPPMIKPKDAVDPRVKLREELEHPSDSDQLSVFELEELRMDLVRRGVPAHEIETIMEQARELPRELVQELLKSMGIEDTDITDT